MGRRLWLAVVFALAVTSAAQECDDSDVVQEPETLAPSMLQAHRLKQHLQEALLEHANGTCAPLALSGLVMDGCDSVAVGKSCKVSCPSGLVGAPVRYFCFSGLAAAGQPPAALMAPVCRNESSTPFEQGREMALAWGQRGCLQCSRGWRPCELLPDAEPGDARCTLFKIDLANNNRIMKGSQCIDMFGGPQPGLWRCNNGDNQDFFEEVSTEFAGTTELCVSSGRGKICLGELGRSQNRRFFDTPLNTSLLTPAFEALAAGDAPSFLQRTYMMQVCRARLESGAPDSFWDWLRTQDYELIQALFSTFPVHPGQIKLFAEMLEMVGPERFQGMASFAVALSWVNRMKESIDSAVFLPHPNMEMNDNGYLRSEMDRIRQEMIDGKHCNLQSNECRDLHRCCGPPETWNFTWPRDPSPSVKEWLEYWLKSVRDHEEQLWMNPLKEVPWMYAVYVWPSPVEECEWVHKKLIEGEEMEGRWYLYDSSFHNRVCAGGKYHPDSLPGIAVYGGVCGRMAQLEWRKTGCMGQPATMKGEPGHCAGYKYKSSTAVFTTLNVITDYSKLSTMKVVPEKNDYVTLEVAVGDEAFPNASATTCVYCPRGWRGCETRPAASGECSHFTVDTERKRLWLSKWGQCFDMRGGPAPGLWGRCGNSPNANQDFTTNEQGELVVSSGRGTLRIRTTKVPPEPYLDECLACRRSWRHCDRVPSNSSDCTHFHFEEETGLIRVPGKGQCFDMHSGPNPGLWSCNPSSDNQRASVTDEGYLRVTSSRGQLTFERFAIAADASERGRCLACRRSWRDCDFSTAGAEDCTIFQYEPDTKLVRVSWGNQCLDMKGGPKAGLYSCSPGHENQAASVTGPGSLQVKGARGQLDLFVPNNGTLPNITTKWQYQGIHEIECTKGNCHFHSIMGLDSKSMFLRRHKEAAKAALESFNDYEHKHIFPTAHDEARLAASLAFALHKESALGTEELAPLVSWALKRNAALYEAWELAADLHAAGSGLLNASGMPRRDALESRAWYETLSLLRIGKEGQTQGHEAADRFAREHLLDQAHWVQFPQLRRHLVGRLCGALSDGVLEELGEDSEACLLVRELSKGYGWDETEDLMVAADIQGTGNIPAQPFEHHWEALARLALAPDQGAAVTSKLAEITEHLLAYLTVGYVNSRSETFFAEHGRVLLRSPYAHVLQLAAAVLPEKRRWELLRSTAMMLQKPSDAPDRLWGHCDKTMEAFLLFVSSHGQNRTVFEEASASDAVNGFSASDAAGPEVMDELQLDRDQEVELGAIHWHEARGERPYDAESLLKTLLRLHGEGESSPESPQEASGLASSLLQQAAASKVETARAAQQSELLQMCMDDLAQQA